MVLIINNLAKMILGATFLMGLLVSSANASEFGQYNVVNVYAFPPQGSSLGELQAFLYNTERNQYEPVVVSIVGGNFGVYFYGTYNCPRDEKGKVVDKPCAFMQRLPFDLKNKKALSPLEHEIGKVLSSINRIEFSAWSRYALSYEECGKADYFRISLQFGVSESDKLVSITVPFSDKDDIEFKDMELKSKEPCRGMDIFFTVDALHELLKKSYDYKAPLIELPPK